MTRRRGWPRVRGGAPTGHYNSRGAPGNAAGPPPEPSLWKRRIERLVLGEGGFRDPEVLCEGDTLTTPLVPGLRFDVRRVLHNPLLRD